MKLNGKNMRTIALFCFLLSHVESWTQGVKISANPGNPDPSAILELGDSTQGFLLPRLTTLQRNAINAPAIGLQIVNITTECIEVYFSGGWKQVMCNCSQPPAQPGNIAGSLQFCTNQAGVIYSISPVPGTTSYFWTVPPGANIVSGQGTTSITLDYGNSGGAITVTAQNTCGNSPSSQVTVVPSIPSAGFVPMNTTINNATVFTPQSGYASYTWSFSNGSPATSALQNPSVTWTNAGSYAITLIVVDNTGCADTVTQNITVSACQPVNMTFTHCGATGRLGPNQTQCNNTYGPGVVVSNNGIQEWVVPYSGTYRISCYGGQGSLSGGQGAIIQADVSLVAGSKLHILAGQQGENIGGTYAAGGGGSFVGTGASYSVATPVIIAGGGGGVNQSNSVTPASNGSTNETGNAGQDGTAGGTNGNGGNASGGSNAPSAGGGGFYTNGGAVPGTRPAEGGFAFQNGGNGGRGETSLGSGISGRPDGAFGGAGGSANYAGGGGGYSGGGGSSGSQTNRASGGGGSYIIATATNVSTSNGLYNGSGTFNGSPIQNLNVLNTGNGYITIVKTCP